MRRTTWSFRCRVKTEKKQGLVQRVRQCYDVRAMTSDEFQYLYEEDREELCERSSQYLIKWLETVELVEKRRGQGMGQEQEEVEDRYNISWK